MFKKIHGGKEVNSQIQTMLERYACKTTQQYESALKEIIQEVALSGLSRAKLFNKASFCGGTALRIFHGLDRFSEDLDFALVNPDDTFDIKEYFASVRNELLAFGFEMTIEKKEKQNASAVQSAFLKGNTQKLLLQINSINPPVQGVVSTQKTRVKLEIDTNPPEGATYDERYLLLPMPYQVRLMDLSSMLSRKIHAILVREYVKGRDLYDYVWYLQHRVTWNQEFLKNALLQTNSIEKGEQFDKEEAKVLMIKRFSEIDFDFAKNDVLPFLRNTAAIDVWRADFFRQITESL
jgi:predicted nucleotidyltransferase component of viral defense system